MSKIDTSKMIFVFGSNVGGIHGGGAAKFAREQRGAQMGVGHGLTGQSYALPTKGIMISNGNIHTGNTLGLYEIKDFVDQFLAYASENSWVYFQVTRIGCGLAGLKDEDIAPMFDNAPHNCWFDLYWKKYLKNQHAYWGSF